MAGNELGISDGAAIAFLQPSFALKLNRITDVEHLMSSCTIADTLLPDAAFLSDYNSPVNCL